MYRIDEILTPQERMTAIRVGMMRKLASMGIGPKQFIGMVKSAQAAGKGELIKNMLLLAFGIGVPVGVASYAVESRMKPKRDSNRDYKRRLDAYNEVISQLSPEKKKDDEDGGGDKQDQAASAQIQDQYGSSGYASYTQPYSYEKAAASPILTGAAAGLLGGGSIAALQAIISDYIEAKRQKKMREKLDNKDVSPDTVVLYLKNNGQKVAEDQACEPGGVRVVPTNESKEVRYRPSLQPREIDGRYASVRSILEKKGLARATNNGLWIASAIAASPFGYAVIRRLSDRLEEKRLQAQVAAAQKEYVDLLSGEGEDVQKVAEAFFSITDISGVPGFEKTAGFWYGVTHPAESLGSGLGQALDDASKNSPEVRGGENILSMGIAAAVLSGLASAYVTNRSLHKNFDPEDKEKDDEEAEKAKQPVKRVLFKGASGDVYEITPEQALTTIAVLRDCIADSSPMRKSAQAGDPNWVQRRWNGVVDAVGDAKNWAAGTARNIVDNHMPASMASGSVGDWMADRFMNDDEVRKVLKEYEDNMRSGRPISPDKKGYIYELIKNHPDKWLGMMGSDEFKDMRQLSVDYWLDKKAKGSGVLSTMLNIPIIGDLTRYIAGLYTRNTAAGRRKVALEALIERGMTREEAEKVLARYDFTGHGTGWALANQDGSEAQPGQQPQNEAPNVQPPAAPQTPPAPVTPQTPPAPVTPQVPPAPVTPQTPPAPVTPQGPANKPVPAAKPISTVETPQVQTGTTRFEAR